MKIKTAVRLHYRLAEPTDILLQIEAAALPEQIVTEAAINVGDVAHFARVPAQDGIGERIWLHSGGDLVVRYHSSVTIDRARVELAGC